MAEILQKLNKTYIDETYLSLYRFLGLKKSSIDFIEYLRENRKQEFHSGTVIRGKQGTSIESYSDITLKKALRELKEKELISKISRGKYELSPSWYGEKFENSSKLLIPVDLSDPKLTGFIIVE